MQEHHPEGMILHFIVDATLIHQTENIIPA